MNNAVGAIVTSMGTGNVDTVLIAGKIMKRNGRLLGVDFNKVSRLAYEARDRVVARSGFQRAKI